MRTSEVSYWHNTYKLARSHGVLYHKGINCVVEHQITQGGPPSKCAPRPEGAQAASSCLTHSPVGKQDHICFQHMLWGENMPAGKLGRSSIKVTVCTLSLSALSGGIIFKHQYQRQTAFVVAFWTSYDLFLGFFFYRFSSKTRQWFNIVETMSAFGGVALWQY